MTNGNKPMGAYKLNVDAAKKRADEAGVRSKGGGGGDLFLSTLPQGKTRMRILPPWSEDAARDGLLGFSAWKHFLGKKYGFFTCGAETFPDKYRSCPICDVLHRLENTTDTKDYQARQRVAVNVIVRAGCEALGQKKDKDGFRVWQASPSTYNDLLAVVRDHGDVSDPVNGSDVTIIRQGTKLDTEYHVRVAGQYDDEGELVKVMRRPIYVTKGDDGKLYINKKAIAASLELRKNLPQLFAIDDAEAKKAKQAALRLFQSFQRRAEDTGMTDEVGGGDDGFTDAPSGGGGGGGRPAAARESNDDVVFDDGPAAAEPSESAEDAPFEEEPAPAAEPTRRPTGAKPAQTAKPAAAPSTDTGDEWGDEEFGGSGTDDDAPVAQTGQKKAARPQ